MSQKIINNNFYLSNADYENNLIDRIINDHISQYDIIVNLCEDLGVCTPYQILRALKLLRDNK